MSREQRTSGGRRRRQAGFTIVETLVVAGLAGIVAMIGVPRIPRMVAVYDTANTASQIALDLRLARERALTTNARARLNIGSTAYTPQRESPSGSGTYISDGAVQNLPNGITVTTNPSTPIFDARGLTAQAYTVTVTNAYGDTKTITVTVIGRINVS
jgi:Tfp pilus assembly protein FimT